jgi:uncharacterized protein (DUF2252 family)
MTPGDQPTVEQRLTAGRALRKRTPRTSHAQWRPPAGRDPIALVEASSIGRVPELVPIRYGRMLRSPFAFLRGSAAVMAADLSKTPVTALRVQAGGDSHLLNFGVFATPERNLVFDINDFDETLEAPWEWDLKRLAASVVVAGRHANVRARDCRRAALEALRSYRLHMRGFARLSSLEVWFARIKAEAFLKLTDPAGARRQLARERAQAMTNVNEHVLPKLTRRVEGRLVIKDNPPLVYHTMSSARADLFVKDIVERYHLTLRNDLRVLFERYRLVDVATKVVGVGSVGTRCAVALFMTRDDDPLFLQVKEAVPSVLEKYAGKSRYRSHGERVVTGQRVMQAASDMFLGWTSDDDGRDYYVRQLRDMKASIDIDKVSAAKLAGYASLCGWALARAHARSGRPAEIAGYLGKAGIFDGAVASFAEAYADQTERDYALFAKAVKSGRLKTKLA